MESGMNSGTSLTTAARKNIVRASVTHGFLVALVALPLCHSALAQPEPESPVQAMRNKISAGDILSAESLLEVYRQEHGEGDHYLYGLGWLARGALLAGDREKARLYAKRIRELPALQRSADEALRDDRFLRSSFGAALEVEAQLIEASNGVAAAVRFLQSEVSKLEPSLVALRSRLFKRINVMSLNGKQAPAIEIEDFIGKRPPTPQSLRGQPLVLFLWAEWCGDCKSQASLLARARRLYEDRGLRVLTVTRYYDEEDERSGEKSQVQSVWEDVYRDVGTLPMILSTAGMERYGASSTPTYVFINSEGIVRDYLPYRLTESEFDRRVAKILD